MKDRGERCILIPARLNSSRLPGKVLLPIKEIPMVVQVAINCMESKSAEVIVLTPDDEVAEACAKFGIKFSYSSSSCQNGTERIIEFSQNNSYKSYISVQADEPSLSPDMITDFVHKSMHENCIGVAKISHNFDLDSDSIVKIVKSNSGKLLYASRSSIPFDPNSESSTFKHVGIYSYNKEGLRLLDSISVGKLEHSEKVEILRFLENDIEVKCVELDYLGYSIDTIQDYKKITSES